MDIFNIVQNELCNLGASKSAVICVSDIDFDISFRDMCRKNLCGHYGVNYSCPPYAGEAEELINRVKSYEKGVLFSVSVSSNGDMKSSAEKAEKQISKITFEINEFLNEKGFEYTVIAASSCKKCMPCKAAENKECPLKNNVFKSLSAYCIDITKLAQKYGFEISWQGDTVTFFALVLVK